ncbi:TetR family transcriptional regulator [Nonomuraea zeae]|uniref:TetR family transcriptional regulator n=1 Tax=Nonomuraea zeae TaxID=1642303 RepID=A0A5S4H3L0_9ACTN|nr:TetR family transcriptional regulator [Nonomuraea zeae]TMR39676.1 TetR family transcriptional regulator [Nonomuraea zeae]
MTDDTRSRILKVALDLFATRGYHATSIREIAERLDLTKTAVLYHFPSKKDIVAALAEPMLADMEAVIDAAGRAQDADQRTRRWMVVEGLLDVWLTHRHLLRMQLQDLALAAEGPVYERFKDAAFLAEHHIAGPAPDHVGRIRAVQAFAMLSDPVVMFADLPADMLRPAVLSGVERLLDERPARPAASPRRRGRPGAMTQEAVETARRLHASGEHTAAEIARLLGVSRATLYRHLPPA